jgi:hypothetical protein
LKTLKKSMKKNMKVTLDSIYNEIQEDELEIDEIY